MSPAPHLGNERVARGDDVIGALATLRVTICGAGALGANLAEHLARMGLGQLRVIDRDRVEERNLATQPWHKGDVGRAKATVLATQLYRAVGADVEALVQDLSRSNARSLLEGSGLVVDCFDNSAARGAAVEACATLSLPCLHVGLAKGFAEVVWDERYRVPRDGGDDACDVGIARSLVMLAVATAAEAVVAFAAGGEKRSHTITLGDLRIAPLSSR